MQLAAGFQGRIIIIIIIIIIITIIIIIIIIILIIIMSLFHKINTHILCYKNYEDVDCSSSNLTS